MKGRHLLLALCVITSCKDVAVKPELTVNNTLNLPTNPYNYGMGLNPNVVTVGRVLFYDPRLSFSKTISCSSCHKQQYAFSDNTALSKGIYDQPTLRNTISLDHAGSINLLFWDGRAKDLAPMVLMPIANDREMGVTNLADKIAELNSIDYYKTLSLNAFGPVGLTKANLSTALVSFIKSMTPQTTINSTSNLEDLDSDFDRFRATGSPFEITSPYMNASEKAGFILFMNKYNCSSCHNLGSVQQFYNGAAIGTTGPIGFANIGLDVESADKGVGGLTYSPTDYGMFRIPSLRNIALTAPYMHDGRYQTLSDVIDHYSEKIQSTPNLSPELRTANGQPKKFIISPVEKEQLIAFLQKLTSSKLTTDPKWSNPFKK